jgi:hypothetical protein
MMESREVYLTQIQEQPVTLQVGLTPAENRLLQRLRRLANEQCRGALLIFEETGFTIYRLSDGKKA